jgi:iron complex transport system ATP-binding protein
MYDLHSVTYARGKDVFVRAASFQIERATFCALLGPRGAGKSTLLRLLAGHHMPSAGTIEIDGRDVRTYDTAELAAARALLVRNREGDFSLGVCDGGAPVAVTPSRIVLLDEPTRHLDSRHHYEALHAIHRLTRRGITVVAALNDLHVASHFADHVVLMHRGDVVAHGTPSVILQPSLLESVFRLPCAVRSTESTR